MTSQFNELSDVTKAAIRFYHALSFEYGKDKTAEAFTAINSVLGHSWSKEMLQVFMERGSTHGVHILGSNSVILNNYNLPLPSPNGNTFIEMIKAIRYAFSLGLGETKGIADRIRAGEDQHISWPDDATDVQRKASELMTRFRQLGIQAYLI